LHLLAPTCRKKNCAQTCKQSGNGQREILISADPIPTCRELTGPTGSYRDLENVRTVFVRVICAIRGHSAPTPGPVGAFPTFGVVWFYLVQFGALWS
jgi:hypothetical protein